MSPFALKLITKLLAIFAFLSNFDPTEAQNRNKLVIEGLEVAPMPNEKCFDGEQFEDCDFSKFPTCKDTEYRCYNRTNRRDRFQSDGNPAYYIDYNRVFCYPLDLDCSSCTPGRFCRPEKRCILDEAQYPCEEWL